MKNIFLQINDIQSPGVSIVVATVVRTRGSTPQKPGSTALFGKDGLITGTVGGGVSEGKVEKLAIEAIETKRSGLHLFDLANEISDKYEAICGGQLTVLTDASPEKSIDVFEEMRLSLGDQIPGVLVTQVSGTTGYDVSVTRYWATDRCELPFSEDIMEKIRPGIKSLISEKNPASFQEMQIALRDDESLSTFFFQPFFPREKLLIAGAGHIGRALAHLGSLLDFEVIVVDDRPEFANKENIPDADHLFVKDIGEALNDLAIGDNSYVVIVTRGHKDDALALRPCIGRDLAYTGMIGSRTKIAAMRGDFLHNGWATTDQWDKIHAPVGLAIKSQTVEEIAVSIAAELVLVRNSKT
jgi:xanthine dehydrogenase accessory factor